MKYRYVRDVSDDGVFDIPEGAIGVTVFDAEEIPIPEEGGTQTTEILYYATYLIPEE